ncbi:type II secretion system F family protein [Nesterenkonia sp. HG001]|uniref:type II secretion system F family protein n=1 Tax=Nesterenkonia sp. HG001 TaxID=2983207 RepID=UPI002AC73B68|nr:type II secretion system F family protein [Nesterenkonia sp. HG001]MDZ5077072.1 type II secretion system F family protein [Nesterenkonia sp. HG001]
MGEWSTNVQGTLGPLTAGILLAAVAVLLLVPRASPLLVVRPRRPWSERRDTDRVQGGRRRRGSGSGPAHRHGRGHGVIIAPGPTRGAGTASAMAAGEAPGEADAAMLLDLTAALLTAGVGIEAALDRLARTIPGAAPLAAVHRSLVAGADWEQAWAGQSGELAELGAQLSFAHATGAPTAELLQVGARQLRRRRRHAAERRAEELGVKMVLPLGACFLPAFILLGVIPVVLGLLPQVFSL